MGATSGSYTTPPVASGYSGAHFSAVVTTTYGSETSSSAELAVR